MITIDIPESNSKKLATDVLVEKILNELKEHECNFSRFHTRCSFYDDFECCLPNIEFQEVMSAFRNKGYYVYVDNTWRNPNYSTILIR